VQPARAGVDVGLMGTRLSATYAASVRAFRVSIVTFCTPPGLESKAGLGMDATSVARNTWVSARSGEEDLSLGWCLCHTSLMRV